MGEIWTKEDIEILREYGKRETSKELQKRLPKRTTSAINVRRSLLGIECDIKHKYNSGKPVKMGGYIALKVDGTYKGIHRIEMEKHLGRDLKPAEKVHHIDCDKENNVIENLYLCKNKAEHGRVHNSIQSVLKPLLKQGIISFNKKEGIYIINND